MILCFCLLIILLGALTATTFEFYKDKVEFGAMLLGIISGVLFVILFSMYCILLAPATVATFKIVTPLLLVIYFSSTIFFSILFSSTNGSDLDAIMFICAIIFLISASIVKINMEDYSWSLYIKETNGTEFTNTTELKKVFENGTHILIQK